MPKTNLILLIVENLCPDKESEKNVPKEVNYAARSGNQCDQINQHQNFDRKRPKNCFSFNRKEFNISMMDCGRCSGLKPINIVYLIAYLTIIIRLIL